MVFVDHENRDGEMLGDPIWRIAVLDMAHDAPCYGSDGIALRPKVTYREGMGLLRWLLTRESLVLAVKAGVAAGLAYFIGARLPEPLDQYAYYSALGAFTVVGLIVVDSITESLRMLGAVLLGVIAALAMQAITWTNPLTVAIAVMVCVMLSALPVLGAQRTWAPLVALFLLATGGSDPAPMAMGYLVQVPLGALIGIVVNLVLFAPLGGHDLDRTTSRAQRVIAAQMRSYAEVTYAAQGQGRRHQGSHDHGGPGERERIVEENYLRVQAAQTELRTAIIAAHRALRANPRARRYRDRQPQLERAEAIHRCGATLGAVGVMLAQAEAGGPIDAPPAASRPVHHTLRRHVAQVLVSTA